MPSTTSTSHGIRNRLLVSGLLTVIVGFVATALMIAIVANSIATLNERSTTLHQIEAADEDLMVAMQGMETFAFDLALTGRDQALEELDVAQDTEHEAYAELERLGADDPELLAAVAKIRDLAAKWRTRWLDPFVETVKAGDPAIGAEVVDTSEALYLPIEKALDDLETLTAARHDSARAEIAATAPRVALLLLPVGLIAVFVFALNGGWLVRSISGPLRRLNETARDLVAGASVTFKAERDDEVGALANILERLRVDASDRYNSARLEASRAATFNQLAELTSFAQDEDSLVEAAVKTLRRIAPTPRGHIMLVNNSTNRLIVAAGWGDGSPTPGEPSPINRIDRCPGIRRATAYVSADLSDDMSVRCPAHPVETGSVVCLPMPALGSIVGVIHLERPEPNSFDSETVQISARVAEQVALAIANARLMKTMEGLAMTDPLTGLRNARFFDQFLEQEFASGERDGESTAVIMLDVDHFKRFNDTYGHPAGDEALRALARSLRSLVRASDGVALRWRGVHHRPPPHDDGGGPGRRREDPRRHRADGRRDRPRPLRARHDLAGHRWQRHPQGRAEGHRVARRRGPVPGQGAGSQPGRGRAELRGGAQCGGPPASRQVRRAQARGAPSQLDDVPSARRERQRKRSVWAGMSTSRIEPSPRVTRDPRMIAAGRPVVLPNASSAADASSSATARTVERMIRPS
jgi:GAF domain-containing protein/CHASE3 domain sensor protein